MSEILIVLIVLSTICISPFIVSFFVAMFCVKEMPTENRRPSSINDCVKCMFFDGYTDTQYTEWYHFFVYARCPIIGFITTVCLGLVVCIWYLLCGLFKLTTYIPGAKQLYNYIGNTYNKIINYKFR